MSDYPSDLKYTKDHEWARREGDLLRVGVTAHAVAQLGDITLVELPAPGTQLSAAERFGEIESVKTVSELFAPMAGEVVEVNGNLSEQPELVNAEPYDKGWMLLLRPSSTDGWDKLLNASDYQSWVAESD